jgi:phage replication O-like protein O
MARPDLKNGFLRLANELAEAIVRTSFTGSQLRILLAVIRDCYRRLGGRKAAYLSLRRMARMTNLHLRTVRRELDALVAASVLFRQGDSGRAHLYGVVKDYQVWNVSRLTRGCAPHGALCATGRSESAPNGAHIKEEESKKGSAQESVKMRELMRLR